jgi:hypothetical protein
MNFVISRFLNNVTYDAHQFEESLKKHRKMFNEREGYTEKLAEPLSTAKLHFRFVCKSYMQNGSKKYFN